MKSERKLIYTYFTRSIPIVLIDVSTLVLCKMVHCFRSIAFPETLFRNPQKHAYDLSIFEFIFLAKIRSILLCSSHSIIGSHIHIFETNMILKNKNALLMDFEFHLSDTGSYLDAK